MNPNAGEPVNPGGAAVADKPNIVNPGLDTSVNNISPDPLSSLQGAVDAAKEAAAAQTPISQFENQFGSGPATPTVAESDVPGLMGQALANLGSTPPVAEDVSSSIQPLAEVTAAPQPEETALDSKQELKDDVIKAVEKFLKAEREKVVSS